MAGLTMTLEGLADLDELLGAFSEATGKNILKRAAIDALQPVDEAWRANAPTGPGRASGKQKHAAGRLKRSGGIGTKLSKRQAKLAEKDSYVEVAAGPGPNVEAIQTEFGNDHQAARPFLRPAWDATKDEVANRVAASLEHEITRATERAARKSQRHLVKGAGR